MTEREKVVQAAQAWVGLKESDGSFKKIIDAYNAQKPLPGGYKVKYTDPWCEAFRSAVGVVADIPPERFPRECSCVRGIEAWKTINAWVENDAYVPIAGDIIYYDWQDSGSGDNTGAPDHVGIVEKVVKNTITVIEGNKSDAVGRREIAVNGKFIRGFAVPPYLVPATTAKLSDSVQKAVDAIANLSKDNRIANARQWSDCVKAIDSGLLSTDDKKFILDNLKFVFTKWNEDFAK